MDSSASSTDQCLDLVGGPFAVIESDPGVFTSLTRNLGVSNVEVVEVYDIEPWAVDHLNPHGLIFCFRWKKDTHRPGDFRDPAAEHVWFANQLSDDACASHAILNVLLNCPHISIGGELHSFRSDTEKMSPVMKGLAISNSSFLRQAHNALARPADVRGALNAITTTTLREAKAKAKLKPNATSLAQTRTRGAKPPPTKRAKTTTSSPLKARDKDKEKDEGEGEGEEGEQEEAYHFIGYVPAYGKVWELDGLKSGPLEVGELPVPLSTSHALPQNAWMDVVRPVLRMKMDKYGGVAEGGDNIRFSLLAIVDGVYEQANDALQLLKRQKSALERQMGEDWETKVDPNLLDTSQHAFGASPSTHTFAVDFGSRSMDASVRVQKMPQAELVPAWEQCVRNAVRANVAVEDELNKAATANTEHLKRTFDYQPFFKTFLERLHAEGLLNPLLGREADGSLVRGG